MRGIYGGTPQRSRSGGSFIGPNCPPTRAGPQADIFPRQRLRRAGKKAWTKTHFPVARAEPSLAAEAEYRPRANVAALAMRGPEGVEKILPGIPTPMMAILRLVKPKQYRARFVQVWFRRA